MSFSVTPNKLEAVFIQRNSGNTHYDQINISGSDLIVYLDSTGKINADKISVWAATYGLGGSGTSLTTGSTYPITSSWAVSASWSPSSAQSPTSTTISLLNTLTTLYSVSTGSYNAGFFDYVAISQSNSRCGTLMGNWINGTISYNEVTTTDIGDTSQLTMSIGITGNTLYVYGYVTQTIGWNIKLIERFL